MLKIAVAQIESSTEKQANLDVGLKLINEASNRGAELIVFPEFLMAFSPASQSAVRTYRARRIHRWSLRSQHCAPPRKRQRSPRSQQSMKPLPSPNRVYDTAIWIDNSGNIASVYRKLHLYDAFGFKESDKFHPGADIAPLTVLGDGRFGMMICYDLRFPELARMLTLQGANILLAPSGWVQGDLKLDHWQTMIKARALENGCYVIAPDQVRQHLRRPQHGGRSARPDPGGSWRK